LEAVLAAEPVVDSAVDVGVLSPVLMTVKTAKCSTQTAVNVAMIAKCLSAQMDENQFSAQTASVRKKGGMIADLATLEATALAEIVLPLEKSALLEETALVGDQKARQPKSVFSPLKQSSMSSFLNSVALLAKTRLNLFQKISLKHQR
jgi:hypothetical protein